MASSVWRRRVFVEAVDASRHPRCVHFFPQAARAELLLLALPVFDVLYCSMDKLGLTPEQLAACPTLRRCLEKSPAGLRYSDVPLDDQQEISHQLFDARGSGYMPTCSKCFMLRSSCLLTGWGGVAELFPPPPLPSVSTDASKRLRCGQCRVPSKECKSSPPLQRPPANPLVGQRADWKVRKPVCLVRSRCAIPVSSSHAR